MYSILIFLIFYCFSVHAEPTVGAIRWDAWTGGSVGSEVEKSLGPLHWHYRVPFFGEVISDNVVTACCTTQACVDQEIHYANHAKLDYFAFLLYDDSYLMSIIQIRNQFMRYCPSRRKCRQGSWLHGRTHLSDCAWWKAPCIYLQVSRQSHVCPDS